jgi:hypothetical protein
MPTLRAEGPDLALVGGWAMTWRAGGAALLAAAGATVSAAQAHEFACQKTVNGEVVHEIRHYPAKLRFQIVVTNTHPDPSTALAVEDKVLESLGFKFTPAPPFTLAVGASVTSTFEVKVKSQAECLALAQSLSCGGEFDDVFKVIHDVGETDCAARIICSSEQSGAACSDDEDHHGDDEDTDADRDDDHHDSDDCGCKPHGKKHGLGFWKVHEEPLSLCVAAGPVELGVATVRTMADFEGILWGSPAEFADGSKRSGLDKERFLLARKLLVATCNVRVLGAQWEQKDEPDQALAILRGKKCEEMEKVELELDKDRDCDGKHQVEKGPATPQHARSIAADPTRPSADQCEDEGGGR